MSAIQQAMRFFIGHLPSHMHVVIATREDLPLPFAHYRARGSLTEVRSADLRFTEGEAAIFLEQVMGLHLTPDQVWRDAATGEPCDAETVTHGSERDEGKSASDGTSPAAYSTS